MGGRYNLTPTVRDSILALKDKIEELWEGVTEAGRVKVETEGITFEGDIEVTSDISDRPDRELGEVSVPDGVQLTGSKAEEASAQETETATTVETYTRAAGATEIGVFVESGFVRVRTDGDPATPTTGVPLGEGFFEYYAVATISVYFVQESTITVVSK